MKKLMDIRPGEGRRLWPIAGAYALVLASVYVLKPARNALFLDRLGIDQLPYVLMLVALVGGVTASVYSRYTQSVRIDRLVSGTLIFLIFNLLIFWWLLGIGADWVFYLFYVWVNLYGLMGISLLWLLANAVFNAREGRRLFGFIGSGGIAGAIGGGVFTGWAVTHVGTENMLLVCAGLLVICLVLVRMVRVDHEVREDDVPSGGALQAVLSFPLLRYMALMAGVVAMVAAISDVQFNEIVADAFPSKNDKTAFFGTFFAYLNGFSFLFQVFFAPRILKRFGVGGGLLVLPVTMGLGAAGILLMPGLLGGIAVKVGDIGFRHSIHKSAVEILFLPVPSELKKRTKVFLDTTVDNLATGLGAVFVLALTGVGGVTYQNLAVLSLALVVGWCWLLYRVRGAYVDAFRSALERREILPDDMSGQLADWAVRQTLIQALHSSNERQMIYALDLLTVNDDPDLLVEARVLLTHASAEIRWRALRVLLQRPSQDLKTQVFPLLEDDDSRVRVEAVHFLRKLEGGADLTPLHFYLNHHSFKIQSAALGYVASYGQDAERQVIDGDYVKKIMHAPRSNGGGLRAQMVRVIGVLNQPNLNALLPHFMDDVDPLVVNETILSLGQLGHLVHLPWLLRQLGHRGFRVAARQAVAKMGTPALSVLEKYLVDETLPLRVRRHIPRVICDIPEQGAVDLLLGHLDRVAPELGYLVIKALSKLRASSPHLAFDDKRVQAALVLEAGSYYAFFQIHQMLVLRPQNAPLTLLKTAVKEHQRQTLERIFRLLGLQYDAKDMYHAYLGMMQPEKAIRANALEFLDNVLERHQKKYILPLLEADERDAFSDLEFPFLDQDLNVYEDGLRYLILGNDTWLKACALNCIEADAPEVLLTELHACADHAHPLVSETARLVLHRFEVD